MLFWVLSVFFSGFDDSDDDFEDIPTSAAAEDSLDRKPDVTG